MTHDRTTRLDRSELPMISVIACARDAERHLADALAALATQRYAGEWELLVVDDGSHDRTAKISADCLASLPFGRVVRVDTPTGISHARNVGAHAARGELLLYCDADDETGPDWITNLAVTARHADIVGGYLDDTKLNGPITRTWRDAAQTDRSPLALGHLAYAPSSNLAIWRDTWSELGGFDEGIRGAGEDVDLSWRAQNAGLCVAFAPAAVVHYRHRDTLRSLARQSWRYGRADAMLQRRYLTGFSLHPRTREGLRWLVRNAPRALADPRVRGRWVRIMSHGLGWLFGRTLASADANTTHSRQRHRAKAVIA